MPTQFDKPSLDDVYAAIESGNSLEHYGMPRRSGRYPWGSGDDPYQHRRDFLGRVEELKKKGWSETPENIKKEFGMTTTQYRTEKALAKDERRSYMVARAKSLSKDGLGATEIGRKLGVNESTVRSLLNADSELKMKQAKNTAAFIKKQIQERGMIDVGAGVEIDLGISREKLNQALAILENEGYPLVRGGIPQINNKGQQTNQLVICPKDTPYKVNANGQKTSSAIYDFENVHSLREYTSHDSGDTFDKFVYPKSMDPKRLMIRYEEDGGKDMDGVIELRRGCKDLSLGDAQYSQVRILVDNNRYLKGMAIYADDLPDGVDVRFNTNKSKSVPKMEVLKEIKDDPDNPFGSLIKAKGQSYYEDENGKKQLSLINKTREEGDWSEWSNGLPSQFLSKQSINMAEKQLKLAIADKQDEYDSILRCTNPTIQKHLLQKFSDECDAAAVDLKAAALPGQKYKVILPNNTLKEDEVYAPSYKDGTKLALIRYPHGGTFEIPICKVNNKNPLGKKLVGDDPDDAVCINSKVAERLSGADFDGDTVMCIPTHDRGGKVKITSTKALEGLKDFDPKDAYATVKVGDDYISAKDGHKVRVMKKSAVQQEMGKISNLITDMTLKGADFDEIELAVKHSMVVIDAQKHKLDYKQSEVDNNIAALKEKYQEGGASTLISRAKSQYSVDRRQGTPKINIKGEDWYDPTKPEGAYVYKNADDLEYAYEKVNKKTGAKTTVTKRKSQQSTRMAETDDATTLISDANTPMEKVYANYANTMKRMANQARVTLYHTGKIAYSPSAKKTYAKEVKSLLDKLDVALSNAPIEREAQRLANATVNRKIAVAKESGTELSRGEIQKVGQQALSRYRSELGSVSRRNRNIVITDREWEAIQAGAVSENTLVKILNNSDIDSLRQRATPRSTTTISQAKINRIQAMSDSNYTSTQIAEQLNLPVSTVRNVLKGEK